MAAIEQTPRPMMGNLRNIAGLNGKLAFPVLFYLVAVMLPIGFNVGPLYMNLVRLVLLVMIVPLTVQLFMGQFGRLLLPDIFFFLHIFWILVATIVVEPQSAVQHVGSTGIEFIGSYVLARAYIQTAEQFVTLIRALVLMIVITLPFALYETVTNDPLILQAIAAVPGILTEQVVRHRDELRLGVYRVQGTFAHPIHYGIFCSLGVALCFVGLKGIYGTVKRYVATAIIILCTFLSLSSGALLPVALQVGLIAWAVLFKRTRFRWLILVLLLVTAYIIIDLLATRSPLIVFMSYATFSPWNAYWRVMIFDIGMENVWANPWFGLGLNGDLKRPDWMANASVDNFWLVVALRYGFPGIICLLIGFLSPLWAIGRRKFDNDLRLWQLRRAWMIVFVGLTLSLVTVHVWSTLFSFVFFMFGAGMFFLSIQPNKGKAVKSVIGEHSLHDVSIRSSVSPNLGSKQSTVNNPEKVIGKLHLRRITKDVAHADRNPQYTRFPPRHD